MGKILIQAPKGFRNGVDAVTLQSIIAAMFDQLEAKGIAHKMPDAVEWFGDGGKLVQPLVARWWKTRPNDSEIWNALQNTTKGVLDLEPIIKKGYDIDVVAMAAFALFKQCEGHEVILSDANKAIKDAHLYFDAYFTMSHNGEIGEEYTEKSTNAVLRGLIGYPFISNNADEPGFQKAVWLNHTPALRHYIARYTRYANLPELDSAAMLAALAVTDNALNNHLQYATSLELTGDWKNNVSSGRAWELGKYLQELRPGATSQKSVPLAAMAEENIHSPAGAAAAALPAARPKKQIGLNIADRSTPEEIERFRATQMPTLHEAPETGSESPETSFEEQMKRALAESMKTAEIAAAGAAVGMSVNQNQGATAATNASANWEDNYAELINMSEEEQIKLLTKESTAGMSLYQTDARQTEPKPLTLDDFKDATIERTHENDKQPAKKNSSNPFTKKLGKLFRK